jgi:hypothetical protein
LAGEDSRQADRVSSLHPENGTCREFTRVGQVTTHRTEEYWLELRRKANQNLKDLAAGKYRKDPKDKEKTELERAQAWEIGLGDMVLEMRQLTKIELRLSRKAERGKLSSEEHGYWEEIDARLDTLREELKDYTGDELRRFVRLWNKSLKKGSVNGPPRKRRS